jgi:hypothetical protein
MDEAARARLAKMLDRHGHRMSPRAFGRYAPCLTNFCSRVHLVFGFNSAADFREIPNRLTI